MRRWGCLLAAAGATCALSLLGTPARADEELPMLDRDRGEIRCLADGAGELWRVQCDEAKKTCLYAPNGEVDDRGKRIRPLARATQSCVTSTGTFDRASMAAEGLKLLPARADAPYGWTRDERQRVFQVSFDLHKRMWLGASWSPAEGSTGRVGFDVGLLEIEAFAPGPQLSGARHRLRLVTGEVRIAPFSADAVLFHYDVSRRYETPLIRVTTFLGRPRRWDFDLSLGFWIEGGGIEVHHAPAGDEQLWRFGTLHGTLDLWQSADMASFVRVRGGLGAERTYAPGEDRAALTPGAAFEAAFAFDRDGFHHLTALASWEEPRFFAAPAEAGDGARRLRGELTYELIVLAVNDQPVTLRLGAAATWRDDIPGLAAGWSWNATAGLRLSLWAPAPEPPGR